MYGQLPFVTQDYQAGDHMNLILLSKKGIMLYIIILDLFATRYITKIDPYCCVTIIHLF